MFYIAQSSDNLVAQIKKDLPLLLILEVQTLYVSENVPFT